MKRLLVILHLLMTSLVSNGQDTLVMTFWNIENFYDYVDGGTGESDREFSSFGNRRWTKRRFQAKCDAIAKSFMWIGEEYGRMPDVIGLAEVENSRVLWKLLNNTLLRKYDYKVVHFDSGDRRGIDVALLYRGSVFRKVSVSLKVPEYEGMKLSTRDILQVCLEDEMGQKYNLIVNHHPSKYGGSEISSGRRNAAMLALKEMCDSLAVADPDVPVIAMGDFNDTPDGEQFDMLDCVLSNKAVSLFNRGEGTIRYRGKWELIDMFMTDPGLDSLSCMSIVRIPFLMTYERKYPGLRPLRTYTGPKYTGGVSDHCPIILCIFRSY